MKKADKIEAQSAVIHAALSVMYREDMSKEALEEARKQIARIEKLFGFVPFSFNA